MKQTFGRHPALFFRMRFFRAQPALWHGPRPLPSLWTPRHCIGKCFAASTLLKTICLLLLSVLVACGDDLTIRDYRVPKAVEKTGKPSAGLSWKLPKNWSPKPAGNMRLASFVAPTSNGSADVSVSQLSGNAGGIYANVNRWRAQIGLPPASPSEIRAALKNDQGKMGRFRWVDLHNPARPNSGIYAAIFSAPGATLFVKMAGPPAALQASKAAFLEFCRSLKKTEVRK